MFCGDRVHACQLVKFALISTLRSPRSCRPGNESDKHYGVFNQAPPFTDKNLFDWYQPFQKALAREGAAWAAGGLRRFGAALGSAPIMEPEGAWSMRIRRD